MALAARSIPLPIRTRGALDVARLPVALRDVLVPFLATRLLFLLITATAPAWIAFTHLPDAPVASHDGWLLDRWFRWDAVWYLRVATDGYRTLPYAHGHVNLAFFPLYPLLVHGWLLLWPWSKVAAALLVANLCALAASYSLYQLVALDGGRAWARRAVWVLACFPTSLFFVSGYSEGLFLLCLLRCFYGLRQERWWRAALWGVLATLTRPLGVILVAPFLIAWYERHGSPVAWVGLRPRLKDTRVRMVPRTRRTERPKGHARPTNEPPRPEGRGFTNDAAPWPGRRALLTGWRGPAAPRAAALIPVGLLGYMAYLGARFGNPLIFSSSQRSWHRALAWPWQTIGAAVTRPLAHLPRPSLEEIHAATDTLWGMVFLALTVWAVRVLPRTYSAFLLLYWLAILCTPALLDGVPDPLISLPRFLLVAFPLVILLAATRRRALITCALSLPLLILYTMIFVSGGWVA